MEQIAKWNEDGTKLTLIGESGASVLHTRPAQEPFVEWSKLPENEPFIKVGIDKDAAKIVIESFGPGKVEIDPSEFAEMFERLCDGIHPMLFTYVFVKKRWALSGWEVDSYLVQEEYGVEDDDEEDEA